jgi:hypothetical protein
MMEPGYYIVTRTLTVPWEPSHLRFERGDWLVTDGLAFGRFDKEVEFDWLPFGWFRGAPVTIPPEAEPALTQGLLDVPFGRLQQEFHKILSVEPGEALPDMPRPQLAQLESYLRSRRVLVAYTYER